MSPSAYFFEVTDESLPSEIFIVQDGDDNNEQEPQTPTTPPPPTSSQTCLSAQSSRPRRQRQRNITLQPGTAHHRAFFGQDDSFRETFDQDVECEKYTKMARRQRSRQDSSTSLKAGRPVYSRYGSF